MHGVARPDGLGVPSGDVRRIPVVVAVVAGLAATVLVAVAAGGLLGLGAGGGASFADGAVRATPRAGLRVPVPDGWTDRAAGSRSVVVELEQRDLGGLVATRGLWVSRWTTDDPDALVAAWGALGGPFGPAEASVVGGRPARHRVERLGPTFKDRLPELVARRRSIHRLVAFDHVYEVGFWGPASTVGDAIERTVIAGIQLHEPPPLRVDGAGWAVDVPGRWDLGTDCLAAVRCAFAPPGGGRLPPAWVYLFDRGSSAPTLEAAAESLRASLLAGGAVDLVHEPATVAGGRPAVRFGFGHRESTGAVSSIEELLVERPDGTGFAVVALGWRTDEGRAVLDSVLGTLRPYHPAP
jgi:hypothetical protein